MVFFPFFFRAEVVYVRGEWGGEETALMKERTATGIWKSPERGGGERKRERERLTMANRLDMARTWEVVEGERTVELVRHKRQRINHSKREHAWE